MKPKQTHKKSNKTNRKTEVERNKPQIAERLREEIVVSCGGGAISEVLSGGAKMENGAIWVERFSVAAAWCKLLGTLCTSIECHHVIGMSEPWLPSLSFLTFLGASIFATDVLYTYLVTRDARERAKPHEPAHLSLVTAFRSNS